MLCSYCLRPTDAPTCERCVKQEREYIIACKSFMGTGMGWSGLVHSMEIAQSRIDAYDKWKEKHEANNTN